MYNKFVFYFSVVHPCSIKEQSNNDDACDNTQECRCCHSLGVERQSYVGVSCTQWPQAEKVGRDLAQRAICLDLEVLIFIQADSHSELRDLTVL